MEKTIVYGGSQNRPLNYYSENIGYTNFSVKSKTSGVKIAVSAIKSLRIETFYVKMPV